MNIRVQELDASQLGDHYHLNEGDKIYFFHEYSAGQGYSGGPGNSLISNLKKPMDRSGRPEWKYKIRAIRECGALIKNGFRDDWLRVATLVPVPPSKIESDPLYDDRMLQICNLVGGQIDVDVRELVRQLETTESDHMRGEGNRLTVDELIENYAINEALAGPEPTSIAIIDDVLTVGRHFRAMQFVLSKRFPKAEIIGIFIARRVPSESHIDFSALFSPIDVNEDDKP